MSTKKAHTLKKIAEQIAQQNAAYAAFEKIPDSVFDTLYSTLNLGDVDSNNNNSYVPPEILIPANGTENDSIDGKKGLIYNIIKNHGAAIQKRDIVKKFFEGNPKAKNPESTVTFALSALRGDGKIKNYNPSENGNVKAGYWTLPEWWDGDKLIDKYKSKVPYMRATG